MVSERESMRSPAFLEAASVAVMRRGVLGGYAFEQGVEDLGGDVAGHEVGEELLGGCVEDVVDVGGAELLRFFVDGGLVGANGR